VDQAPVLDTLLLILLQVAVDKIMPFCQLNIGSSP
jgi:hypothetical protein